MSAPSTDSAPTTATATAPSTTETETVVVESPKATIFQKMGVGFTLLFVIAWVVGGIAAIIMSLVCFGFSGTTTEKVLGLLLAFFLGPLYFIFYAVNKNYCRSMPVTVATNMNRMMGGFMNLIGSK
jgi:hypothetical protein